jgi:hypothetical protein
MSRGWTRHRRSRREAYSPRERERDQRQQRLEREERRGLRGFLDDLYDQAGTDAEPEQEGLFE